MVSQGTGYLCVLVACLSFGSNFVPAKKVDIKDGQYFTFWMGVGIALVGLVQWFIQGMYKFEPLAMIGGATWATANLFAPFIIRRCGLGLGQLGWCVTNMMTGWATGAFGLFRIHKAEVSFPGLNYFGVALNVCALLVITQMGKPQSSDKLLDAESARALPATRSALPQSRDLQNSLTRQTRGCAVLGCLLFAVLVACACVLGVYSHDETLRIAMVVVMAVSVLAMAPVGVYLLLARAQLQVEEARARTEDEPVWIHDRLQAAKEEPHVSRHLCSCTALGVVLVAVLALGAGLLGVYPNNETLRITLTVVMAVAALAIAPVGVYIVLARAQLQAEQARAPMPEEPVLPAPAGEPLSSSFVVQAPGPAAAASGSGFMVGLLVAMAAGVLMGSNFDVPTILQQQGPSKGHSENPLDYVVSHYMGILALTSCFFLGYKATAKECYTGREVILPGLVAGILWGIAQVCWFVANGALSFAIAFPMITGVPGVLAIMWGMALFGENRDPRSLKLLGIIMMFSASSLACIAASH